MEVEPEYRVVMEGSLGSAYRAQLEWYCESQPGDSPQNVTVMCKKPVADPSSCPESMHIDDWESACNLGWEYGPFAEYDFQETGKFGHYGKDWIHDRIVELLDGMYSDRLGDQIEQITERLQDRMHGSSTNALVAQVFNEADLNQACVPRPNANHMACLTQLQFHPVRDTLHLHQSFRSQWVDLKAFGNLVAGAVQLQKVAAQTDYTPGWVISYVRNATARSESDAQELHKLYSSYEQHNN